MNTFETYVTRVKNVINTIRLTYVDSAYAFHMYYIRGTCMLFKSNSLDIYYIFFSSFLINFILMLALLHLISRYLQWILGIISFILHFKASCKSKIRTREKKTVCNLKFLQLITFRSIMVSFFCSLVVF